MQSGLQQSSQHVSEVFAGLQVLIALLCGRQSNIAPETHRSLCRISLKLGLWSKDVDISRIDHTLDGYGALKHRTYCLLKDLGKAMLKLRGTNFQADTADKYHPRLRQMFVGSKSSYQPMYPPLLRSEANIGHEDSNDHDEDIDDHDYDDDVDVHLLEECDEVMLCLLELAPTTKACRTEPSFLDTPKTSNSRTSEPSDSVYTQTVPPHMIDDTSSPFDDARQPVTIAKLADTSPSPSTAPIGDLPERKADDISSDGSHLWAQSNPDISLLRSPVVSPVFRPGGVHAPKGNSVSSPKAKEVPPREAKEWACRECSDEIIMSVKREQYCVLCHRKYNAGSRYYDRDGRVIKK